MIVPCVTCLVLGPPACSVEDPLDDSDTPAPRAPLDTPVLLSTGFWYDGATAEDPVPGFWPLRPYCDGDFTLDIRDWGLAAYFTVRIRGLGLEIERTSGQTHTTNSVDVTLDSPSLLEGLRPNTSDEAALRAGADLYYIANSVLTDDHVDLLVGLMLGNHDYVNEESGELSIRAISIGKRSEPLRIRYTRPVSLDTNTYDGMLWWRCANCDRVSLHDGTGNTEEEGYGEVPAEFACRDSVEYVVVAERVGCTGSAVAPTRITEAVTVTNPTSRTIGHFNTAGLASTYEGMPFHLNWDAPGATNILITGPYGFSFSSADAAGDVTVTAPTPPLCVNAANYYYELQATWPGCEEAPRRERTGIGVLSSPQYAFLLSESGGPRCDPTHQCAVTAHSYDEAVACASCSIPWLDGCRWQ